MKGSRSFLVRALPNAEKGPRLGLIVGKKVAPRSVDRNRVKRLVRITHRQIASELGNLDVVVQLRGSPRNRDNAALFKELQELLRGLVS
jgi:ribonuclease P protein component